MTASGTVTANQGTAAAIGAPWPTRLSDGTNALGTDTNPLVTTVPPYSRTTFGQVRVAAPFTLLDSVQTYYLNPNVWGTQTVGAGTVAFNTTTGATALTVTAANGDAARLRTHSYFLYQACKEQRIRVTGFHSDAGSANQTRRWGYFETNDGLFFSLVGTTFGIVVRSSTSGAPVDTLTTLSLPAALLPFDLTKIHIYEIEFQWLSVGPVLFWIDGVLVANLVFTGVLSLPFMRTAVLPVECEVVNTAASSAGTFNFICAAVYSEGGDSPPAYSYSAGNTADVSVGATEIPLVSIRPALTFKGRTNRIVLLPFAVTGSSEGHNARYLLRYNATLTGPVWVSVNTDSAAEFDVTSTAVSGGTILASIYVTDQTSNTLFDQTRLLFNRLARQLRVNAFATAQDTITVSAFNEGAGSTSMRAAGAWTETG